MAVNKKEKKKHLLGCFECADGRAGVWACGRADGCAEADNCKEKKKERKGKKKRKTHWSGRVDMLRMGVHALAGGRGWL